MDQSVKAKRRFSKDMISKPLNFEHRIHTDTQAQAESVLREISKSPVQVNNKLDLGRILGRKGTTKGPSGTSEYSPVSRSAPEKSPLESGKPKTYYSLMADLRDRHSTAAGSPANPNSLPDGGRLTIPRGITKSSSTIGVVTLRPVTQDPDDINELFISTPNPGGMPVNNGVSLVTKERSIAAKIYFENYFDRMCNAPTGRAKRRMQLEQGLQSMDIPDSEKRQIRSDWMATESEHMRQLRNKISIASFDILKTIGHGAFGVVKLVREKSTGELYAMKVMRKADMLRKGQEGHVRAERDLLSKASESALWIVKLVYSFQDHDHLYLVMEYMPGGDLLSLLIKKDVFDEDFARPYVAEMVTCIEEAHKLGYVHRDVKPDNFLFDEYGHLRLSDFGLATDFHWAHDSAYYEAHRRELNAISAADRKADERDGFLYGDEDSSISPSMYNGTLNDSGAPINRVLVWRENRRRKVAYSVVGTNNYIAPEVLRGSGYDKGCDWWSLGVIIFEMLYGYPPFCSKSRQNTKAKILNWQQTLAFPSKPRVSHEVRNLIENLICDRPNRLGCAPCDPNDSTNANGLGDAKDIKSHPWFRGINWDRLATAPAPFVPELKSDTDTSYFDEIEADETLPTPEDAGGGEGNGIAGEATDGEDEVLDMRKNLAFVGFTYRAVTKPKRVHKDREGVAAGGGAGGDGAEESAEGQEERRGMSRASSF